MALRLIAHGRLFARSRSGSHLAEFAPSLVILIAFVVIPLLDLTIVPVRWMLAHEIVNDYARRLALCESFGESHVQMEQDPSLKARLLKLGGVSVKSINLTLRISRVFKNPHMPEVFVVKNPGQIPKEWLPDGSKAPCSYALDLDVDALLSPAITFPQQGVSIPGFNQPISFLVSSSHEWENFARNPRTGKFFINE
jgi:hypothetical protein